MKPLAFTVTGTLVTLALSLGPSTVWAQGRPSGGSGDQGGARPSGGGTATGGTAVSRGGAGGGSTSTGSSGGGSASPSGSSGGSSGSSWGGSSAGSVERPGGARMSGGGARVDPRRLGNNEQRGEAVPRGARPNPGGDRVTGQAVPREGRPPVRGGDGGFYSGYNPYYYGGYYSGYYPYSSWGYSPWGLGGLYFSNPFWWGYGGYPYWGDYGYGGYGGYGYGSYGGYYGSSREYMRGSLKLKVKPKEAEVFVDGYFMGQVDSFDGTFQQLSLEPGTHRIEIRAKGLEPVTFEVRIDPRETITYRGELHPVK